MAVEEFKQNQLNNNPILDKILKEIINNPILRIGEIFLFFNAIVYLMMNLKITNNPLKIFLVALAPYIITIFLYKQIKRKTTISFFANIYFIIVFSILILAILFFINIFLLDYSGHDTTGAGFGFLSFVIFSFGLTIFSLIFGILKEISIKINK